MDSILQSAKKFFAGTMLSRVLGLARDVSMAFCFGSAPEVGAFMVAYRLANLLRRLLGEGNLQGSIIPQFERLKSSEGEGSAALFWRDLSGSLILVFLVVLGVASLLVWNLSGEIAQQTLLMAFGVIFLSLYALDSAILQCQKRYFLPAAAPAAFNVVWIVFALSLRNWPVKEAMFALSWGIVLAFACQWLLVAWPTHKWAWAQISWRRFPKLFSPEIRKLLLPLFFGVAGVGATQVNSALDALFARLADPSGPVYLWYAIRVQQLPLALIGIALSSALLPPLSRAASAGDDAKFTDLLTSGLRRASLLLIPCSLAMIVFAEAGLDLLFGRGDFTAIDVARTAQCLRAYAVGLVPMVFVLILASSFFARRDYKTPMRSSLLCVICNVTLNALFIFALGQKEAGIALATSISAVLNCALLWRGNVNVWRICLCSAIAALVGWGVDLLFVPDREFMAQATRLAIGGGVYVAAFLASCHLLKEREIFSFLRLRA